MYLLAVGNNTVASGQALLQLSLGLLDGRRCSLIITRQTPKAFRSGIERVEDGLTRLGRRLLEGDDRLADDADRTLRGGYTGCSVLDGGGGGIITGDGAGGIRTMLYSNKE
jgi:hypothetical protein